MILRKTSSGWEEVASVDRCPECDWDWRPARSYGYRYRHCNCRGADHKVYACAHCGYELWVPPHVAGLERSTGYGTFDERLIRGTHNP